jgi:hypothetical protein
MPVGVIFLKYIFSVWVKLDKFQKNVEKPKLEKAIKIRIRRQLMWK